MRKITYTTPEDAVTRIDSGDRVFIHAVAAAPQTLIKPMFTVPRSTAGLRRRKLMYYSATCNGGRFRCAADLLMRK